MSNAKLVILRIKSNNYYIPYIKFRYGKEIIVYPSRVWILFLVGLGLASPNIVFQIIRKCSNKITASCITLVMNIILNFGYGMVLCIILNIERFTAKILAGVILSIYAFMCLICCCMQFCDNCRAYFDVIYNLCHKLEDSKTLKELVSFNRKLFPLLYIGCKAQHEESREVWKEYEKYQKEVYKVITKTYSSGYTSTSKKFDHYETEYRYLKTHYALWKRVDEGGGKFYNTPGKLDSRYDKTVERKTVITWTKELEYKYSSWQDETKNIEGIKYCSIIETYFDYSIIYDQRSKEILEEMKTELYNEGKNYDTDVLTEYNFRIPDLVRNHTCSLNDVEYQRIRKKYGNCYGYFCWTLCFILGYTTIFEAFARYEIGKITIKLIKYVSNAQDKRALYRRCDQNPDEIIISYVHTKIQMKSLEKKQKKGLIGEEDLKIPLVLVN